MKRLVERIDQECRTEQTRSTSISRPFLRNGRYRFRRNIQRTCGVGVVMLTLGMVSAQDPQPTCRDCPATYVSNEELQEYLKWGIASKTIDQQVRAIDVGKLNVDVAMVHRGKLDAPAPDSVAEHDLVGEVYHVIDGSATFVTGPDLVDKKRRPATNENVRLLNGPGHSAASIRNGITHQLQAGDVIVIPAGTGHWFTKIEDHISYLMIRVDPDKVTPLLNETEAKASLARKKSARPGGDFE